MSKKRKKYIPKPQHNPAWLARRQQKDRVEIERLSNFIKSYHQAYSNHISYLGNFARHDIKNAIQSIDSILFTTEPSEFTQDIVDSLSLHLNVIRSTTDNFAELVPYSTDGTFTIDTLLNASQLLFRADMVKHGISIKYDYSKDSVIHIKLPFQSVVQMINNLLINCIKALENIPSKHILVKGSVTEENVTIEIYDNGIIIEDIDKDKVFEYGYSTTGGSGIGLYHAQYMCETFKGSISLSLQFGNTLYNKVFTLILPISEEDGKEYINY